ALRFPEPVQRRQLLLQGRQPLQLGLMRCPEDLILQLEQRLLELVQNRVETRDEVVEDDQQSQRGVRRDLTAEGAVYAVDAVDRTAKPCVHGKEPGAGEEHVYLDGPTGRSRGERGYPELLRADLESGPLPEAWKPGPRWLLHVKGRCHCVEF